MAHDLKIKQLSMIQWAFMWVFLQGNVWITTKDDDSHGERYQGTYSA